MRSAGHCLARVGEPGSGAGLPDRAQELLENLKYSQTQFSELGLLESNRVWIEKLLVWYYDPMYAYSLGNRNPKIEFEGSDRETIEYLSQKIKGSVADVTK